MTDIQHWPAFQNGKWRVFEHRDKKARIVRYVSVPAPEKLDYPEILKLPDQNSALEKIFGSTCSIQQENQSEDQEEHLIDDTDEESGDVLEFDHLEEYPWKVKA